MARDLSLRKFLYVTFRVVPIIEVLIVPEVPLVPSQQHFKLSFALSRKSLEKLSYIVKEA